MFPGTSAILAPGKDTKKSSQAQDFNEAMDEIDKDL